MDTQPRMHFFPHWDRCENAQRRSHTAQDRRESRHDPKSGGGMLPVGFKAAGDLSLVCGHQVSYPKDVPGSGRSRLPSVSGQCWTPPAPLVVLKQRFFPKPGSQAGRGLWEHTPECSMPFGRSTNCPSSFSPLTDGSFECTSLIKPC